MLHRWISTPNRFAEKRFVVPHHGVYGHVLWSRWPHGLRLSRPGHDDAWSACIGPPCTSFVLPVWRNDGIAGSDDCVGHAVIHERRCEWFSRL